MRSYTEPDTTLDTSLYMVVFIVFAVLFLKAVMS
jgi:hypothetical protein